MGPAREQESEETDFGLPPGSSVIIYDFDGASSSRRALTIRLKRCHLLVEREGWNCAHVLVDCGAQGRQPQFEKAVAALHAQVRARENLGGEVALLVFDLAHLSPCAETAEEFAHRIRAVVGAHLVTVVPSGGGSLG